MSKTLSRCAGPALVAAVLLSATIVGTGRAPAAAQTKDPFVVVRSPEQSTTTYLTTVNGGARLAIVVPAVGDAVGYLCDGTGTVSTWFSGPVDRTTGIVSLAAKDTARIQFTPVTRKASLTRSGKQQALTLELAQGTAGLYRKIVKDSKGDTVIGWIAGNDRVIVGTASLAGVPVASITDGTSNTRTTPKVVEGANVGLTDAFVDQITQAMLDGPIYIKIGDVVTKPR